MNELEVCRTCVKGIVIRVIAHCYKIIHDVGIKHGVDDRRGVRSRGREQQRRQQCDHGYGKGQSFKYSLSH